MTPNLEDGGTNVTSQHHRKASFNEQLLQATNLCKEIEELKKVHKRALVVYEVYMAKVLNHPEEAKAILDKDNVQLADLQRLHDTLQQKKNALEKLQAEEPTEVIAALKEQLAKYQESHDTSLANDHTEYDLDLIVYLGDELKHREYKERYQDILKEFDLDEDRLNERWILKQLEAGINSVGDSLDDMQVPVLNTESQPSLWLSAKAQAPDSNDLIKTLHHALCPRVDIGEHCTWQTLEKSITEAFHVANIYDMNSDSLVPLSEGDWPLYFMPMVAALIKHSDLLNSAVAARAKQEWDHYKQNLRDDFSQQVQLYCQYKNKGFDPVPENLNLPYWLMPLWNTLEAISVDIAELIEQSSDGDQNLATELIEKRKWISNQLEQLQTNVRLLQNEKLAPSKKTVITRKLKKLLAELRRQPVWGDCVLLNLDPGMQRAVLGITGNDSHLTAGSSEKLLSLEAVPKQVATLLHKLPQRRQEGSLNLVACYRLSWFNRLNALKLQAWLDRVMNMYAEKEGKSFVDYRISIAEFVGGVIQQRLALNAAELALLHKDWSSDFCALMSELEGLGFIHPDYLPFVKKQRDTVITLMLNEAKEFVGLFNEYLQFDRQTQQLAIANFLNSHQQTFQRFIFKLLPGLMANSCAMQALWPESFTAGDIERIQETLAVGEGNILAISNRIDEVFARGSDSDTDVTQNDVFTILHAYNLLDPIWLPVLQQRMTKQHNNCLAEVLQFRLLSEQPDYAVPHYTLMLPFDINEETRRAVLWWKGIIDEVLQSYCLPRLVYHEHIKLPLVVDKEVAARVKSFLQPYVEPASVLELLGEAELAYFINKAFCLISGLSVCDNENNSWPLVCSDIANALLQSQFFTPGSDVEAQAKDCVGKFTQQVNQLLQVITAFEQAKSKWLNQSCDPGYWQQQAGSKLIQEVEACISNTKSMGVDVRGQHKYLLPAAGIQQLERYDEFYLMAKSLAEKQVGKIVETLVSAARATVENQQTYKTEEFERLSQECESLKQRLLVLQKTCQEFEEQSKKTQKDDHSLVDQEKADQLEREKKALSQQLSELQNIRSSMIHQLELAQSDKDLAEYRLKCIEQDQQELAHEVLLLREQLSTAVAKQEKAEVKRDLANAGCKDAQDEAQRLQETIFALQKRIRFLEKKCSYLYGKWISDLNVLLECADKERLERLKKKLKSAKDIHRNWADKDQLTDEAIARIMAAESINIQALQAEIAQRQQEVEKKLEEIGQREAALAQNEGVIAQKQSGAKDNKTHATVEKSVSSLSLWQRQAAADRQRTDVLQKQASELDRREQALKKTEQALKSREQALAEKEQQHEAQVKAWHVAHKQGSAELPAQLNEKSSAVAQGGDVANEVAILKQQVAALQHAMQPQQSVPIPQQPMVYGQQMQQGPNISYGQPQYVEGQYQQPPHYGYVESNGYNGVGFFPVLSHCPPVQQPYVIDSTQLLQPLQQSEQQKNHQQHSEQASPSKEVSERGASRRKRKSKK